MVSLKRWYLLSSVLWVALSSVCPAVLAVGPEDAEQWNVKGPITVSITSPANNTYVPINHTQVLTASASDPDCYRVGTTWYDYSDDVTSGETSADYHLDWGAMEGTLTDMYGPSATYLAPEYSAGYNVRDVLVVVQVGDYNRGADTFGADDVGDGAEIHLKVWQVTLTVSQTGTASTNYDGTAMPSTWGGATLGWIVPGTPAGAITYAGNTQIKGSIPEGPGVMTGYQWYQSWKGVQRHKESGGSWIDDEAAADWASDFDPSYSYLDADSRHPNSTGDDAREIFAMDAPWFNAGADNDNHIAAPDNWTDCSYDVDFKTKVKHNGIPISNEVEWEVVFTLDAQGGKWHATGGHAP